jgi:molybdate transport system permease protein
MDATAFWLTLRLASLTTAILFVLGLPLAYWLATTRWPGKTIVEVIVALPLVLPPTVLGFYILTATSPTSLIGRTVESLGLGRLPFTFQGILLASILYNLPFAVRPFLAGLHGVPHRLVEAAWCLGASRWRTFWRITFPLALPGILTGLILTFVHVLGEFGVVLMVGGSIPGITRTLSISIYDDVQALDYESAAHTALFLVSFSFVLLCAVQYLARRGGSS